LQVVFASGVLKEAQEAKEHYESEVDGLGDAFSTVLRASVQSIKQLPHGSRLFHDPYRRFVMGRFPYGIIYRLEENTIYIVAIAHFKRRPFYWKDRST